MPSTMTDMLEQRAASSPRSFLQTIGAAGPRPLPELLAGATCWAGRLREAGVRRGDRVGIVMEQTVDTIETLYGAFMLRAAVVPLAVPRAFGGLERAMTRLGAALRVSGAGVVVAPAGVLRTVPPEVLSRLGVVTVAADDRGSTAVSPEVGDPGDLALVQYTSGSTGDPRGVAITQGNLVANMSASVARLGLVPDDRCVSWLPLYHDMGLIGGVFSALFAGASSLLVAPEEFVMRPTLWLETFTRAAGTYTTSPNFGYQLCVNRVPDDAIGRLDLRSWRLALNGAEPVRVETLEAFASRFARCGFERAAFLPVYGLAESTLSATFPRPGRGVRVEVIDGERLRATGRAEPPAPGAAGRQVVSVGTPFEGAGVRIVDGAGAPVPERTEGEVLLRGPSVTAGYYADPRATADKIRDGWLHTGDLGFVADGDLFITGRLKAVLIRGGAKYHAEDLEAAAERVADVRRGCSAAFAVDGEQGEEVVVVVERSAKATAEPEALARSVADRVRRDEGIAVDTVVVTTAGQVPKTSSGKIQRDRCKAGLLTGTLEVVGRLPAGRPHG